MIQLMGRNDYAVLLGFGPTSALKMKTVNFSKTLASTDE
jgi:hypothetical protein